MLGWLWSGSCCGSSIKMPSLWSFNLQLSSFLRLMYYLRYSFSSLRMASLADSPLRS